MKRTRIYAAIAAAFLLLLPLAGAYAAEPDFEAMVRELDKIEDFTGDSKPDIVCIGASTHNIKLYENLRR